ncbi:hypothetical protein DPEC_G00319080 [Dallia pectoralis]|uniref:Uncharacterized protein n=1 Tax=Dallia pectoralis TaxID=75939 RepID=A0ACC2F9F5_DALPE|nr:hypothetical protein DPEC_G00319080 [Dallia pectoralis]
MKAMRSQRSMRNNTPTSPGHTVGISRSKSRMHDTPRLLYNMTDCYSMLKELVPSLPRNRDVSKFEILQHVIDYILDLQTALDTSSNVPSCPHQRLGHAAAPRNPLATINSDLNLLTFQSSDQLTESYDG